MESLRRERQATALQLLKTGSSPEALRSQLLQKANFFLEGNHLYYKGRGKKQKILFTLEEKRQAFLEAHISEDGHLGIRKTGGNVTKSYYWPGVVYDSRKWVKECKKCQKDKLAEEPRATRMGETESFKKAKPTRAKKEGTTTVLKSDPALPPKAKKEPRQSRRELPAAQARGLFHLIGLQLVGPMKQTPRGSRFVFVAVDHFTRWVEAAPMKTCSPEETAEQLLKLVYRYGFPERVISTQCGGFVQQLNQILRAETKLKCDLIVVYHPQTHGLLEKTNSFVRSLLSLVVNLNQVDWDQQLQKILFLQNRDPYNDDEDEDEEEYPDSLEESSTEDSDADIWPTFVSLPEALDNTQERVKGPAVTVSMDDTCSYCNRLTDEGNSDVFTMLQCESCRGWVHHMCVSREHGDEDWKIRFQCRLCLPGTSAPSSRVIEKE
uniref:Integrase catalytic domain-containing protein n=1 Tax=Vombatus ursinus TaxID=29139 RepID=A0A4X2KYB7_VOMUR